MFRAQNLKTGLNTANIKKKGTNTTNKYSFHAVVFVEAFITEKFSLQPELLYCSQDSKEQIISVSSIILRGDATVKLDYIHSP